MTDLRQPNADRPAPYRAPTADELRLLRALTRAWAEPRWIGDALDAILIRSLDDGRMGSFRITSRCAGEDRRRFGRIAAELEFADDGVTVSAALYLDEEGQPFEVDVWKTNFGPLSRIPDPLPEGRQA